MNDRLTSLWLKTSAYVRRRSGPIVVILAIATALLLFRNYLFGGQLLYGDANFLWERGLLRTELLSMLNAWRIQAGGFSGAIADESQGAMVIAQALFSPLGIPLSTILVLPAIVAGAFIAFWRLARLLGANEFAAIVAAAFYAGNAWLWDQLVTGHIAICIATAIAPVIFATAIRLYRGERGAGWLLLGLCAIELWVDPRTSFFVYAILFVGGVVGAVHLSRKRQPWLGFLSFSLLGPILGIAANGWWTAIFAFVKSGNIVPPFYPPLEGEAVYGAFADLPHALVLSGYFLQFEWHRMWQLGAPLFGIWYLSMLFLLLVPAVLAKDRLLRTCAVVALVAGIVMSLGTHGLPLALLYWMYEHLPFMALLREPVKFGFLVALAIATLLALWLPRATKNLQIATLAAVAIAILPIFTGWFSVPDGHGLQVFSQRRQFLDILDFIRAHDRAGDFRIAVLPPFLAEQQLTQGEFYVANPFVIQDEISVIDAKLINTSTVTDSAAWQAYYGLYWGTDTHPARTLANFGIRYVVVEDAAILSPGGGDTAFAGVPAEETRYVLSRDPGFAPVYHDGTYWIFEDRYARTTFRGADRPLVIGPISSAVRQALPFGTLGDDIDRSNGAALPPGTRSTASDAASACVDGAGYGGVANAYTAVKKHQDYTLYWVASDYVFRGPSTLDNRILARFALPFAFTKSHARIDVPIDVRTAGGLYAQLGTLGSRVDAHAWLDGNQLSPIIIGSEGFAWRRLGAATPGHHVVSFDGASSGLLVAGIIVTADCSHAPNGPQNTLFIPGPIAEVQANLTARGTSIVAAGAQVPLVSMKTPDGTAAIAVDGRPSLIGVPFPIFRGVHQITYYAEDRAAAPLNGNWASRPLQHANPGTIVSPHQVRLQAGTRAQLASMIVKKVPPGQMTLLSMKYSGNVPGTRLWITSADGSVNTPFNLADLRNGVLLIPYLGEGFTVMVSTAANSRGTVVIGNARVGVAIRAGDPAFFTIPLAASRPASKPPSAPARDVLATLSLQPDGNLARSVDGATEVFVSVRGRAELNLRLRGARAGVPARATIAAYYAIPFAPQETRTLADVDLGTAGLEMNVAIPMLPNATGVAFSLRPSTEHVIFTLDEATLSALPEAVAGFTVNAPSQRGTRGASVPFDRKTREMYYTTAPADDVLVGNFTYDVNWNAAGAPHWKANGFQNAWVLPRGKRVAVTYDVQRLFATLQMAFIAFLAITFGLWIVARIGWIRQRRKETL